MSKLYDIVSSNEDQIRTEWMGAMTSSVKRGDLMSEKELNDQSRELLSSIVQGMKSGDSDLSKATWRNAKDILESISVSRAKQGFNPGETATYVLSLKQPIFSAIRRTDGKGSEGMFETIWAATQVLDSLALITANASLAAREQMIARQQQELMELSTPVVKLWEGILALPIIGTLDSARTQGVMENLLATIVQTNSKFAIIDITGVPTVDTLVAQHLLKTITAARLMGAECVISGVRPQIAQTIVHLGIDLAQVITKARLADAFALCLQKSNRKVVTMSDAGSGSAKSAKTAAGKE
jgi:rsbT co-antagonist protein RsbR